MHPAITRTSADFQQHAGPLPRRVLATSLTIIAGSCLFAPSPALPQPSPGPSAIPVAYAEALARSRQFSPGLRLQTLRAERDRKVLDQHSTLLPSAPELEAVLDRGSIHYPAGALDQIPMAESHGVSGYELGLRQQVDVSGLRSTRRDAALKQSALSEHLKRSEELMARSRVRNAYLAVTIHAGMAEHLGEHIVRFTRLRQMIGPGYFDRRLGAYTSSALDMGISSLEATRASSESARRIALIELHQELGMPGEEPLALDSYGEVPFAEIPDDEHLIELAEKGLPMILSEDRLALAQAEEEFAKRKIFPFIELFAAGGKRDIGTYSSPSFSNNSPQREDYLRFGVRVPLGAAGPDRVARNVAEVESRMAAEELRLVRERLQRQVRADADLYRTQRKRYQDLRKTVERGEPMLQAIEAALVARRVTYFEFWSEHERLHDILIKMGESRLKAADALGRLELITATEFE